MSNVSQITSKQTQPIFFVDVVSYYAALKDMRLRQVAQAIGCSPSTLSMIGKGDRRLTEALAMGLSSEFGPPPKAWLDTFEETRRGSEKPLEHFTSLLDSRARVDPSFGTSIRRLRREHILLIQESGPEQDEEGQRFFIDEFDPERLQITSYDTTVGAISIGDGSQQYFDEVKRFEIAAGQSVIATTREAITLPEWMEADIHPASNLARKHLIISNGPIIDPGYDDFLHAAVYNPTSKTKRIEKGEPFLTLRFWIQDTEE